MKTKGQSEIHSAPPPASKPHTLPTRPELVYDRKGAIVGGYDFVPNELLASRGEQSRRGNVAFEKLARCRCCPRDADSSEHVRLCESARSPQAAAKLLESEWRRRLKEVD